MQDKRFLNMSVILTGAASKVGIGAAVAKLLLAEGADLMITDISPKIHERADELRALGYKVSSMQTDLTNQAQISELVKQSIKEFGKIDILINNAGMAILGTEEEFVNIVDTTEEQFDFGIAINLKTAFLCSKAVLPSMIERGYGRIVNTASVTGPLVSNPGEAVYSAAKAGLMGLIRGLAIEVGKQGITVNAVAPGWIATGSSTAGELAGGENTPLGRSGTPSEIGAGILFLASKEASYITGQMLVIDGGNCLQEYKGPSDLYY